MDQGHMNVSDELTGAITDSALSSFLQLPSNVGTVTVTSGSIQNGPQFDQLADQNLRSVGTLYGATPSGQRMSLPLVVSSITTSSTNSSLVQSELQQRLQHGIVSTVGSQSGIKVVLPNAEAAPIKPQPKKSTQGRQPSVKQMIAQNCRAKKKLLSTSPAKAIQPAEAKPSMSQQPGGGMIAMQQSSTVINAVNPIKTAIGSDQPVNMSFQTSDGQMITLPVIVKPGPAKDKTVKRTKTKAELKMCVPQTYTTQTEIACTNSSMVVNSPNVLGAVQNIQTQPNQILHTITQPHIAAGNLQIRPQSSTGMQLISGLPPGTRTVAITQNSQTKSQPMLTLQTAAGNKVMVPVMLNTLNKNMSGTQIKLVPVGFGAGQSGMLQAKSSTEVPITSILQDGQKEPVTLQQGVFRNIAMMTTASNQAVMNPSVSVSVHSELSGHSNQVIQGQIMTQGDEDDDDGVDSPLVSESVIPWLLAPRGNRPVPLKTAFKKGFRVKPNPSSPLVANMHIKCPCYCPPECSLSHHPLLVALLNCQDDADESVSLQRIQMFSIIFNTHINSLPDIHEPVPDLLNQYRVPLGHWAAALGRVECLRYLMRRGFKVRSQAKRTRETPLHFALRALPSTCGKSGIEKLEQMMPTLGVAALVPNAEGCTSLHLCAELLTVAAKDSNRGNETDGNIQFYVKAMSLLLTFTSEKSQESMIRLINSTNLKGDTALHILAGKDNLLKVVTLLVELGADIDIKNYRGATALSTAIIAKATMIVGYLTSDGVKKIKGRYSFKPAPTEPTNPMIALHQSNQMVSSVDEQVQQDGVGVQIDLNNAGFGGEMLVSEEYQLTDGSWASLESKESFIGTETAEQAGLMTILGTTIGEVNQINTLGTNIIQDAAMMSQIAAATSLISQPSTVPHNTIQNAKPDMGRPIPSIMDAAAANTTVEERPCSKKTVLNPPPNSHVIQFIPPANSSDGKPSAPITVYVNSSDGKPLNLTSNDLLTLTQALQAANIGKDKCPTGPVQVILQQNDSGKQASDLSRKVDEVIDVYQNSGQGVAVTTSTVPQLRAGMNSVQMIPKRDSKGRFISNLRQSGHPQQLPQNVDMNQITLDDLTAILKADEHSGGIDFVTSAATDDSPQADNATTRNNPNTTIIPATSHTQQQYVAVTSGRSHEEDYQGQQVTSQMVRQINSLSTTATTTSTIRSYPEVGQLLSRAPLNASQTNTETTQTRKRTHENSDDSGMDTQVIKWAKNDAKLLEGREPHLFPDEDVIKSLSGDEELFEYLEKCDKATQQDVLASLTEQYLLSQKECDKVNVSIQVVDRDIARVEEIHQDTIENMKVLLNKLSDLEEEDKNLSFDSTAFRNEIMVCITTQASLRERLTHCDAALAVLNELMRQRNNSGGGKSRDRDTSHERRDGAVSDNESFSDLSDLDSSRLSDVEDDTSPKTGDLPPIAYGESGDPIEESSTMSSMDSLEFGNKNQSSASATIKCVDDVEIFTREQAKATIKSQKSTDEVAGTEESMTDVEAAEGSTANTTMESADLEEPRSPANTLPIESLEYQDLQGLGMTSSRSTVEDFLVSSQGSSYSNSFCSSSQPAQVVPGSQESNMSQYSFYNTQASIRSGSQSSTISSQGSIILGDDNEHQSSPTPFVRHSSMASSHASVVSSQSSVGPAEENLFDQHASFTSSLDFTRAEECLSSQGSLNPQCAGLLESLPNSQNNTQSETPESSQDETIGETEMEISHQGESIETDVEQTLREENPPAAPNDRITTGGSGAYVLNEADPSDDRSNGEFNLPNSVVTTAKHMTCTSLTEVQSSEMNESPLSEILVDTALDENQISTENFETRLIVQETTDSVTSNSLEDFVTASQEVTPDTMYIIHNQQVSSGSETVTMVTDADNNFDLSQELVTSSQESLPVHFPDDSQEFTVLTQRSVNGEDLSVQMEGAIENDGVQTDMEIITVESDGQSTYTVPVDAALVDEELYVTSETIDSENIQFVTEEIQFVSQESSVSVSSQDFAPVSLESNLHENLEQGLYSQSSVEQGMYSQTSDSLDQDLLVGSQELIEEQSENLIVSQDILCPQEFVVTSSFDDFLV